MINFLTSLKNSIFGIVVVVWGLFLVLMPKISGEHTLQLLTLSASPELMGVLFMLTGLIHIVSRNCENRVFAATANIMIALVFLIIMLTYLYASVYIIGWIAFAGITLNLVINAFLILKGE